MTIQEITSLKQLDNYLGTCKAIPIGVPADGNGFYKLMCQTFKYPNGSIQPREYIDKTLPLSWYQKILMATSSWLFSQQA